MKEKIQWLLENLPAPWAGWWRTSDLASAYAENFGATVAPSAIYAQAARLSYEGGARMKGAFTRARFRPNPGVRLRKLWQG